MRRRGKKLEILLWQLYLPCGTVVYRHSSMTSFLASVAKPIVDLHPMNVNVLVYYDHSMTTVCIVVVVVIIICHRDPMRKKVRIIWYLDSRSGTQDAVVAMGFRVC